MGGKFRNLPNYLRYLFDESDTDGEECCRKMGNGKIVVDAIRSLVNATSLRPEFAKMLHFGVLGILMCDGVIILF